MRYVKAIYGLSGGGWATAAYNHMDGDLKGFLRFIRREIRKKGAWGTQPLQAFCPRVSTKSRDSCHQSWKRAILRNTFPEPKRPLTLSNPKREINIVLSMCKKSTNYKDEGLCALKNNQRLMCGWFKGNRGALSYDPRRIKVRIRAEGDGPESAAWRHFGGYDFMAATSSAFTFAAKKLNVRAFAAQLRAHALRMQQKEQSITDT